MSHLKSVLFFMVVTVAALASGQTLTVQIKEFDVPSPKSPPHDPAIAPDGSLWYTGQAANKLGRLNTKTGEFKEYPLKTSNSGPHGLVADNNGAIWFTAISAGYIGKLDPKSGAITEYRPSELHRMEARIEQYLALPREEKEAGAEGLFAELAAFTADALTVDG